MNSEKKMGQDTDQIREQCLCELLVSTILNFDGTTTAAEQSIAAAEAACSFHAGLAAWDKAKDQAISGSQ